MQQGYSVLSLETWLAEPEPAGRAPRLLLRHDVDQHPASALKMAAIEVELGVRSTWYFRWRTALPGVVETIRSQGHAVGLHYETLTRELLRRGLGPGRRAGTDPRGARAAARASSSRSQSASERSAPPARTATRAWPACTTGRCSWVRTGAPTAFAGTPTRRCAGTRWTSG